MPQVTKRQHCLWEHHWVHDFPVQTFAGSWARNAGDMRCCSRHMFRICTADRCGDAAKARSFNMAATESCCTWINLEPYKRHQYYAWDYTHECILQLWHVRTQKDMIELGSQRIQEGHWKVSHKMQWEPGSCSTNILDWHEFCSRLLDCWRKGSNLFISHAHVKLLKCTASICVWFGKKGSEIDMRHFNHSCKTDNIQEKERESERETYHP